MTLIARGSSDHAAIYGRYAIEYATGLPVAIVALSLLTRYGRAAELTVHLAIGVSQSGATPEIVETLAAARRSGAATIAITNDPDSKIVDVADATIDLHAGLEQAVPATKSLTAQFAVFAHLADALGEVPWEPGDWDAVTHGIATVLNDDAGVEELVEATLDAEEMLTVARGFLYPAALETALKIAETTGIHATGFSSADLLHGLIAVASEGLHVICLVADGPVADDMGEIARELGRRGATVHAITDPPGLLEAATTTAAPHVPEALAPFVQVVRGQQLAQRLALARGIDPDQPRGLSKVTATT